MQKVALVTGAANGLGAGVAKRLAAQGVQVVLADVEDEAGFQLAQQIGAEFVHCDVSSLAQDRAAVQHAVDTFGGLDIAVLNAGVTSGLQFGEGFDEQRYRRVMSINLDGVILGFNAALPALRARGGGDVIATASMAGLAPTPFDPVYAANKTAVVGFVRSAGIAFAGEKIRINAVCPAFADTRILAEMRDGLVRAGVPLLTVDDVVGVYLRILESGTSGEAWWVQPGRTSEPFAFRRAPGPRHDDGSSAPAADPAVQRQIEHSLQDERGKGQ